ncbi:hypothetical protein [Paenibacillus apiarius]|uniref:Uncharacterized protein n=1 Tax=Paenibacillus apiarius TaxID=46240 RepID=A0ABT4DQU2_9BACL|nr:hypothetical protein [Paenibacillus apiarius]MCY9513339.1 hypothetical protein [Paenibacillus apiarius]MCY9519689.1 hypothetical protein [Paenibacillus apiarius]MCY9553255.1 hypothetical protein [Paenibacillus apiarius]MCY9557105.1 hypothetical protein [Paenibacillus apiarius]MCY9682154.1 hypothetical protein [Paenibacillus apiarius]
MNGWRDVDRVKKLRIVSQFIKKEGEVVPLDDKNAKELADRCKLAYAELTAGHKYILVSE